MTKLLRPAAAIAAALCIAATATAQHLGRPYDAADPDWENEIPRIVHPDSNMVRLYETTWEIAANRVRTGPEGLPASPYLDENCYDDQIWIWDSCFMVMFSKYASKAYPGRETLLNLYAPLHDRRPTPLRIHLRDNPPLMAWTELCNFTFSGDREHLRKVLEEKRYLQRHFEWFDTVSHGDIDTIVSVRVNPIHRSVVRDADGRLRGYTWKGGASGMDNTVRGRDAGGYDSILWVDAISQQALSARSIARLCELSGLTEEADEWSKRYDTLRHTVDSLYWDERDGFYYDIAVADGEPCRVMTPASFWAMIAGIPDSIRAARMVEKLRDPRALGGERPWVSLARTDPDHDSITGNYWRGGVWLPIAYMGTKALETYGYEELADSLVERVVRQQLNTFANTEPHTIWECYSPSADAPSTEHGSRVRPDFCGWSALGPISLMIENLLGFREADALSHTLHWSLKPSRGRHGIRNLHFGDVVTDAVFDPATSTVTVNSNRHYTLRINGRDHDIAPGSNSIKI